MKKEDHHKTHKNNYHSSESYPLLLSKQDLLVNMPERPNDREPLLARPTESSPKPPVVVEAEPYYEDAPPPVSNTYPNGNARRVFSRHEVLKI